jgi:archaetidylserine synthase
MNMEENMTKFIVSLNLADKISILAYFVTTISLFMVFFEFYYLAFGILFFSLIVDAFDGYIARKQNLVSNFGITLDSLIDILTYLILPNLILFQLGLNTIFHIFVYQLCLLTAILRLSYFSENQFVEENETKYYLGMPVYYYLFGVGLLIIFHTLFPKVSLFFTPIFLLTMGFFMIFRIKWFKFENMILILIIAGIEGAGFILYEILTII